MCTKKYISFCVFQPFNFHLIVCDYFLMRSWIPRPHLKLFSFFFSFSVSVSLQTVAASMQCDVMPRRILSFFLCFVCIPLKSDFVVCILFSFVVCWCVPVFVEEMMHIKCAIHFHYAVVLMADSFLYFSLSLM